MISLPFPVQVFALILNVILHRFWVNFGTLSASICMLLRTLFLTFSCLFRKGWPLGSLCSLWHPFGDLWLSFGFHLAPIWLPFCSLLVPFGSLSVASAAFSHPVGSTLSVLDPLRPNVLPNHVFQAPGGVFPRGGDFSPRGLLPQGSFLLV